VAVWRSTLILILVVTVLYTSGPVSTAMGDHLRTGKSSRYVYPTPIKWSSQPFILRSIVRSVRTYGTERPLFMIRIREYFNVRYFGVHFIRESTLSFPLSFCCYCIGLSLHCQIVSSLYPLISKKKKGCRMWSSFLFLTFLRRYYVS